jgi:hypothetical protein
MLSVRAVYVLKPLQLACVSKQMHSNRAQRVAEIIGHQVHYWMPPPEQGKDLAECNAREQTAARLAREAPSQADAGASGPVWQKSAAKFPTYCEGSRKSAFLAHALPSSAAFWYHSRAF